MADLSIEELVDHVKSFVIKNYGLKPLDVTLIQDGIASINFYVKTKTTPFIIRFDQRRPLQVVDSDKYYIRAAKINGVNVPPMPILVEDFFGKAISGRQAIIGMTLSERPYETDIIYEAGRQLGLIHTAIPPSDPEGRKFFYNFVFDNSDPRWEEIEQFAYNHPDYSIREISKDLVMDVHGFTIKLDNTNFLDSGLTHGDYKFSNLLIDNNGQLVVLDWEKSCRASPIYDLSLGLFYLVCGGKTFRPDIIPIFLNGYFNSNVPLFNKQEQLGTTMDIAVKVSLIVLMYTRHDRPYGYQA